MPFGMQGYPRVVEFKEKVYIGGGAASSAREAQTVVVYDPKLDFYDTLPPYTYMFFSMAVVNNQLVLVGGVDVQTIKVTNKLGVRVYNRKREGEYPTPYTAVQTHCG